MKNIPWTEEEVKILKKLWDDHDILIDEIAKVLIGRTKEATIAKASTLGLPPPSRRLKPSIDYDYLRSLGVVVEG